MRIPLLLLCLTLVLFKVDAEVVEWVARRLSGDVYKYFDMSSITHQVCNSNTNATFLVADEECVNDRDLFIGCSHAVVPSSQLIALSLIHSDTNTHLIGNNPNTAESFHFNGTGQQLDNSFCQIASLEVFRGWNQTFEISHNGFSLSDNGTVEVTHQ